MIGTTRRPTIQGLRNAVASAILAPSSHNSQPWLFALTHDGIELYADRRRALPVVDPYDRELIMSCGAALETLRVALRYDGFVAETKRFPHPEDHDLLARLALAAAPPPSRTLERTYEAIAVRRTNRRRYLPNPVPSDALAELEVAARVSGASLHLLTDEPSRLQITELVAEADRVQSADPTFRRELAAWLHPHRASTGDGMPGSAIGLSDVLEPVAPLIVRTFDWGDGRAARDRELALGSPAIAVLATPDDDPLSWLRAGEALASVLLTATVRGIASAFLNQPIEVPALRAGVAAVLETAHHPQLIMRLGYAPDVPATPRRPVDAVLTGGV